MGNKILFILWGNIRYDGRVQKEIATLLKFGYNVSLIVTEFDADDDVKNYNYKIYVVKKQRYDFFLKKLYAKFKQSHDINAIIKKVSPDFLHCNDFSTLQFAVGWFKKIKVVYDSHELATEMYSGWTKKYIQKIEKYALKRCYKVIIPQIDRLHIFYFKYKEIIKKEQLYLLENFPIKQQNLTDKFFEQKYNYKHVGSKIISYTGVINNERGIEEVIEAISKLKNIDFFIIGRISQDYENKLKEKISNLGLTGRVFIKPPVPNYEILSIANSSDIGIAFYNHPNLNSYFCASNKLYEYLNCSAYVLTNNIGGTARIIKNGINGYLVDSMTVKEIREAITVLMDLDVPESGSFYWEDQELVLREIYS